MSESLLNLQDQYKFPMGQLIHDQEPDAQVMFRLTNRKAHDMRIADYISPLQLQEHYDSLRDYEFTPEDIATLESQTDKNYSASYLGYLASFRLPEIEVYIDKSTGDLTAETTAPWNDASLWEIPMLASIPELYYPRRIAAEGCTMREVYDEGDRRLSIMIELLQANPRLKFAEFGTRRRFSSRWQDHAVERFVTECPDSIIGTSNPHLAAKYNIPTSGTNAHELAMVYAGITESRGGNPLDGQTAVIHDWNARFPTMPVALIDTFTSDVTLHDMPREQIDAVKSYRIDSGNEYLIGQKVIDFLTRHDIDPMTRTLFFSNSLTPERASDIERTFRGDIGVVFGIGGCAVNNMGYSPLEDLPGMNIVSKAVSVDGHGTVKLSDDPGKHMGSPDDISRYQRLRLARLAEPVSTCCDSNIL